MIKIYNTNEATSKLEEVKEYKKGAWISLVSPSEEEIQEVCNAIDLEEEFLRYPLDYEEKARIDKEDENTHIVIKSIKQIIAIEKTAVFILLDICLMVKLFNPL